MSLSWSHALRLVWAAFLALVITGPWLTPGYWFGTDWPGPRHITSPTEISSSLVLQAALAALSSAIGGEAASKAFIVGIIFAAGLLAFMAAPRRGFVGGAVAATIYVVNPFVYARLEYGQLYLLAGYALLPLVLLQTRRFLLRPSISTGLLAAVSLTLLGIPSLHLFLASPVLIGPLAVAHTLAASDRLRYLRRLLLPATVALAATVATSAYWIIPLFTGHGPEGTRLTGIGQGDLTAFAAVPDAHLGLLPNLLGLYGFWAENSGRFSAMKGFVPAWPAVLAVILAIAIFGALRTASNGPDRTGSLVLGLSATGLIALVLEMGVSHPLTAGIVHWLYANVPPYRGMRDAGKWAAMLALVYSQLVSLGSVAILDALKTRVGPFNFESLAPVVTGVLLAVPLYYGNGLLYGAHGGIQPSTYPVGWYAADHVLAADTHPGRTLFLPWHQYLGYDFIRNQNKVVVLPAASFFSVPIVGSTDPEVPGVTPPMDPDQQVVSDLVLKGPDADWSSALKVRGIKYVLVAKELDWAKFGYLGSQRGLTIVGDFGSIILYRNTALV